MKIANAIRRCAGLDARLLGRFGGFLVFTLDEVNQCSCDFLFAVGEVLQADVEVEGTIPFTKNGAILLVPGGLIELAKSWH